MARSHWKCCPMCAENFARSRTHSKQARSSRKCRKFPFRPPPSQLRPGVATGRSTHSTTRFPSDTGKPRDARQRRCRSPIQFPSFTAAFATCLCSSGGSRWVRPALRAIASKSAIPRRLVLCILSQPLASQSFKDIFGTLHKNPRRGQQ